jgi:hypothetical protein
MTTPTDQADDAKGITDDLDEVSDDQVRDQDSLFGVLPEEKP